MTEFPMKARQEFTRYRCEECGAVNDSHKMKPAGHGDPAPACRDCGAAALRRELVPELSELLTHGLQFAPAVDYWAVEIEGYSQTEWAEKRSTTQQAVSKNIHRAREAVSGGVA